LIGGRWRIEGGGWPGKEERNTRLRDIGKEKIEGYLDH
jgi:hypothetical protein